VSYDRALVLMERLTHVQREDLRAVATAHGLALAQLEALRYLGFANRFSDTVTALVDYLGATKGTLSQTVSALERKGLIARFPDPEDRRVQHCRITAAGEEIVRESQGSGMLGRLALDDDLTDRLEGVLRDLLRARGGRAFGVCATCSHHRQLQSGRRCALLDVDLSEDDAARICAEHTSVAF
jgi:MarR family transcriptional regulator, organic hydroperoxide resistance regulator